MNSCVFLVANGLLAATVACAGTSIHEQVEAAADGATVHVAPGVYRIDRPVVVPKDKSLKIVADDPANTVVDAQGKTNCFVFLSGGPNLLKGLTVRNGRGAPCLPEDETWYAGGIVMRGGTIEGCCVEDCETLSPTKALGGGIATWGLVKDTVVVRCAARVKREHNGGTHPLVCSGGGILLYGGSGAEGCTVADCRAEALQPGPAVGGYGGGIEVFGETPVRRSTVRGCFASMGGGGIHLNSGGHVLGCQVVSNRVQVAWRWDPVNVGGGVAAGGACDGSRIEDTAFVGNVITGIDAHEAPCGGGGLGTVGSRNLSVRNCTFSGNGGFNGGAAYFNGAFAAVSGCRFTDNRAERLGAHCAVTMADAVTFADCTSGDGAELVSSPRLFSRNTDWMAGKVGVFQHRLYGACPAALEAMKQIDPKALAEQLADIGADYFCITLNQCEPSFLAPNDVYEDMCGYRRGEMCNQRDIPMELADALAAKGIRLMLYTTGTPPRGDTNGVQKVGYVDRGVKRDPLYTREGARNWAKVFEFWSRRYGEKVSGWWIDGCYESGGFVTCGAAEFFARAFKAGNPHAVVTFNPGIRLEPYSPYEDYICGEINEPFFETCAGRWLDGRQWHLLTYTYSPMGFPAEVRYTDGEWIDWLGPVLANGGCVTIDARSFGTACLQPKVAAQLKRVIAAVRGRLDPNGEDARRIARETAIRRRTDLVEATNVNIEYGKRQFFRRQYAKADAAPVRALVRKGADGVEIWSDAIQAALDRFGGVRMPPRPAPYVIDRPIVLKSGQSIWMGVDITPLKSSHRGVFKAAAGVKGPLLVNEKPGDANIFVKGVFFEGVENPVRFDGVKGLVVRDLALFGCSGTGLELKGVTDFRVDGVCFVGTDPKKLACGVRADAASANGLIRNVSSQGSAPAQAVGSSAHETMID